MLRQKTKKVCAAIIALGIIKVQGSKQIEYCKRGSSIIEGCINECQKNYKEIIVIGDVGYACIPKDIRSCNENTVVKC